MGTFSTALSVLIGGVVGASFGKSISTAKGSIGDLSQTTQREMNRVGAAVSLRSVNLHKFGELKAKSSALGNAVRASRDRTTELGKQLASVSKNSKHFPATLVEVKRLTTELDASKKETEKLEKEWQTSSSKANELRQSLNKTRDEHKKNQEEIKRHREELSRLAKVEEGRKRISAGAEDATKGLAALAAVKTTLTPAVMKSADYQAIIRDIAIDAHIAGTDKETSLSQSIRSTASDTGVNRNELAGVVGALVRGDMSVDMAEAVSRSVAKFSASQGVDTNQTAQLVLALKQSGINTPEAIETALGKIAVGGDLGAFKADDFAKNLPDLMKKMQSLGVSGDEAMKSLMGMLQVQRKVATSSDEAAANLGGLLDSLNGTALKKKFDKFGYNFSGSIAGALAKGYDPVGALLAVVQAGTEKLEPGKAKQFAEIQAKIAATEDPAKQQKLLDAYIEQADLAEFITDAQTRNAVLAAMKNKDLYRENLKLIESTDGAAKIEKDLTLKREASKKKWAEVGQSWDEALARLGDAITPVTDTLASFTKGVLDFGSAVLDSGVGKTVAVGATAAATAYGLYKTTRGVMSVIGGINQVRKNGGSVLANLPIVGKLFGGGSGSGGEGIGGALGGGGGIGVQDVYVTNMSEGGLGGGGNVTGGAVKSVLDTVKTGVKGAFGATTLGGMAGAGAGSTGAAVATAATSAAAVAAAGAAGYAVGKYAVAPVIDAAITKATGEENSLGTWLYSKFNKDEPDPTAPVVFTPEQQARIDARLAEKAALAAATAPAAGAAATVTPAPAPDTPPADAKKEPPPTQQLAFSPSLSITVNGDVKDPKKLSEELMPHLKRLFDQFQQKAGRADLFDPAHA